MLATPGRMDLVKVPTFVCASAPWGSRVYRGWRGIGLCMMRCNNLLTKDFMPWRLRLLSPLFDFGWFNTYSDSLFF
jgi:hypothetical protein